MSFIKKLQETVAHLSGPEGCPWDREQTHQSLSICLVEECSELLEAIDQLDIDHMCEELGDVLLQVVMHAQIAEKAGYFDLEAVAKTVNEKLIHRHPHVFGDRQLPDAEAVLQAWDDIKAEENKRKGVKATSALFKDLPPRLPALLFARSVYKQMIKKDLPAAEVLDAEQVKKQSESLDEQTAGKLLFEAVGACCQAGIDPEAALRRYVDSAMKRMEIQSSRSE